MLNQIFLSEAEIQCSVLDEHPNIWCIRNGCPANHSIKHLSIDVIHHIQLVVRSRVGVICHLIGKVEQVDERRADGIIVTTTWSNVHPEEFHQFSIEREKPSSGIDWLPKLEQIIENSFIRMFEVMDPLTSFIGAREFLPKNSSKIMEVGFTLLLTSQPHHGDVFIRSESQGGEELLHIIFMIVTLYAH